MKHKMHGFTWADQEWISLMIFKNFADQDWIGFNFCRSGLDSDWNISQSAHLCRDCDANFLSTPAMFCDAMMQLWRFNCTWAILLWNVRWGLCDLVATGHRTMSTSRPKKIVTMLSDHPSGNTQLLNLGNMSFTHTKQCRLRLSVYI